jgi:HPt (histidine-containing phosphotransfer) domain-containing protein
MRGDRERCLQAGFDGYVPKPIQFRELFDTIDRLAPAERVRTRDPSGPPGPVRAEAAVGPDFDEGAALERTGGDRDLLKELIGIFLREMPRWMRELASALGADDARELGRVAHAVKGALDSCGASAAYDAAMLLERMGREANLAGAPAAYTALEREISRVLPRLAAYVTTPEQGRADA